MDVLEREDGRVRAGPRVEGGATRARRSPRETHPPDKASTRRRSRRGRPGEAGNPGRDQRGEPAGPRGPWNNDGLGPRSGRVSGGSPAVPNGPNATERGTQVAALEEEVQGCFGTTPTALAEGRRWSRGQRLSRRLDSKRFEEHSKEQECLRTNSTISAEGRRGRGGHRPSRGHGRHHVQGGLQGEGGPRDGFRPRQRQG